MTERTKLATRLARRGDIVVAPGVYDALTALIATQAGFDTLFVSGAGIAYSRLGRPDIGLVSLAEVVDQVLAIRDRVDADLVVDADTGFGNALNVQRTVRLLERAGANAIQIEDQTFPKRCGHLSGKDVVPVEEMLGKIAAALDARTSSDTLIVARTDAIAVEGFDHALERGLRYAQAGADVVFVEAPRTRAEIEGIVTTIGPHAPILANMVEGGRTPVTSSHELATLGVSMVIFPGAVARTVAHAAGELYREIAANGTTRAKFDHMLDLDGLNECLGTKQLLQKGRSYEG